MGATLKVDETQADTGARNDALANRALDMLRAEMCNAHRYGLTGKYGVEVVFSGGGIRMIRRLVDETVQNG